jgi:hypothetical protein
LLKPMAANETLAKRSFFIVLPQDAVTDAFRRSHDSVNLRNDLSLGAGEKSIRFAPRFN